MGESVVLVRKGFCSSFIQSGKSRAKMATFKVFVFFFDGISMKKVKLTLRVAVQHSRNEKQEFNDVNPIEVSPFSRFLASLKAIVCVQLIARPTIGPDGSPRDRRTDPKKSHREDFFF